MHPTRAMPAQAQSWPSYATADLQLSMGSQEARLGGPPLSNRGARPALLDAVAFWRERESRWAGDVRAVQAPIWRCLAPRGPLLSGASDPFLYRVFGLPRTTGLARYFGAGCPTPELLLQHGHHPSSSRN